MNFKITVKRLVKLIKSVFYQLSIGIIIKLLYWVQIKKKKKLISNVNIT